MIAFLGGTIGNFEPAARTRFFAQIAGQMSAHDTFLLGVDLVKDPARLVRGVRRRAGRDRRVQQERARGHQPDRSVARSISIASTTSPAGIRSTNGSRCACVRPRQQRVTIRDIGLTVDFAAGEEMRTEISAKFRRAAASCRELAAAGLELVAWLPDAADDYALVLTRKP